MAVKIRIRQAGVPDIGSILGVLTEAAEWLHSKGIPMWCGHELDPERIAKEVARGDFFLAETGGGTVERSNSSSKTRCSGRICPLARPSSSPLCGPPQCGGQRGVNRDAAVGSRPGGQSGRQFLRLDCDAARPKLRAFYETFGFRDHSDRQVGPYHVARYEYPVG